MEKTNSFCTERGNSVYTEKGQQGELRSRLTVCSTEELAECCMEEAITVCCTKRLSELYVYSADASRDNSALHRENGTEDYSVLYTVQRITVYSTLYRG